MTKTQFFTRALAAVTIVGALVVTAPTGVPGAPQAAGAVVGDCTTGSDWGTLRQDLAAQVTTLVNQHRASKGLSQLTVSTTLTNASVWKARHMAKYVYMTHNDPAPPVARSTGDRLLACGYPVGSYGWGENIAYGYTSAAAVMQGWLNSSGHRANIENPSYKSLGVGAASTTTGRIYWAQAFGTQSGSTPPPPPPPSYACSNGVDDDGDGKIDYPADPGCTGVTDTNEYNAPPVSYACSNGVDDDGDGKTDYPADPGCTSATDTTNTTRRRLRRLRHTPARTGSTTTATGRPTTRPTPAAPARPTRTSTTHPRHPRRRPRRTPARTAPTTTATARSTTRPTQAAPARPTPTSTTHPRHLRRLDGDGCGSAELLKISPAPRGGTRGEAGPETAPPPRASCLR